MSRGAQLYHFPSKEDLFAKAVEHLSELLSKELRHKVELLPVEAPGVSSRSTDKGNLRF